MLIILLFVFLLAWVAAGAVILHLGSGSAGTAYRRRVLRRVAAVSEPIPVEVQLVPPIEPGLIRDRDVVLVLDHSSSMGVGPGSPLQEAIRAAENFVLLCPPSIHCGLVVFDQGADQLCPIVSDHRQVLRSLRSVSSGGSTNIALALDRTTETCQTGRADRPKTVILLSDGGSSATEAEAAAERLRTAPFAPDIITAGFGSGVDDRLMTAIAGSPDRYTHVSDIAQLRSLFEFLAAVVAGGVALCGSVEECSKAPQPFTLETVGGLLPIGLEATTTTTRIFWSIPTLGIRPVALTYRLVAECPGWHRVAGPESHATWHMPDSSSRQVNGPDGPRVLVLWGWAKWASPILNPLFFILFGRFFCRSLALPLQAEPAVPNSLPDVTLPEPLPAAPGRLYRWSARPALVVGLGDEGEAVLCSLQARLADRGIAPGTVDLLAVSTSHRANRVPVRASGCMLDSSQVVELHMDFRPLLESLRRSETTPMRAWLPFRDWLASPQPVSTHSYALLDDRRKARLALLSISRIVEDRMQPVLQRVRENDGLVLVVGSLGAPDFSGMLAEIAHISAARAHLGVSVVAVPSPDASACGVLALARELERMIAVRGDTILSDRTDPPVEANRLFDRIVVLRSNPGLPATADFIWEVLSKNEVLSHLPDLTVVDGEVRTSAVDLAGAQLPTYSLWTWVRERFLAQAVNGRWLGLQIRDGHFELPDISETQLDEQVEGFWSGETLRRPHTLLLGFARTARNQGYLPAASSLRGLVPTGLYHQQVEFRAREIQQFLGYVEEWVCQLLSSEYDHRRAGLQLLTEATARIESQLQQVADQVCRLPLTIEESGYVQFLSALFLDMSRAIGRVRSNSASWLAGLTGAHCHLPDKGLPPPVPLCDQLEQARQATERALDDVPVEMRRLIQSRFDDWNRIHEADILGQLRLVPLVDPVKNSVRLRLHLFHHRVEAPDLIAVLLREVTDGHAPEVCRWPLVTALPVTRLDDPASWLRVGGESATVFPGVPTAVAEEDPASVVGLRIRQLPLEECFDVAGQDSNNLPFAWPEEANAARIAAKIRNSSLQYAPRPLPPRLVHLIHNSSKLWAFLMEIAAGDVGETSGKTLLVRDNQSFVIGSSGEGLVGYGALQHFESLVRQVVIRGLTVNGLPLPGCASSPSIAPNEAVRRLERAPLVQRFVNLPEWDIWRDLVRGLALDAAHATASSS